MGRNVRTNISTGDTHVPEEEFRERDKGIKTKQKEARDRRKRAHSKQSELKEGDIVWVKTEKDREGKRDIIEKRRVEPDSFAVRVEGKTLRRNWRHLRKLNTRPLESDQIRSS